MPDLALEQTERQIFKLLDAAAGRKIIFLELYALPTLTRGEWGQRHLSRMNYRGVKDLWNRRLDGLIVTGAEPRAADLTLETYWRTLTEVFDWAENNTISTIASCLAVHAAVFHFDRINRYPLDKKCFGVFNFKRISDDQLFSGNPPQFQMPHSRWNEIRERDVVSCGYDVLVKADHHGVDTFVKRGKSLFVFFQGHPEYEAWTLFGEYRRDVERFLTGRQEAYPDMPLGYFDRKARSTLRAFRDRAPKDRQNRSMANFPSSQLSGRLIDPWRAVAARTYANWLEHIAERKGRRTRPVRVGPASRAGLDQ